jgi:alpha,alpha-trehalose phosphorylase
MRVDSSEAGMRFARRRAIAGANVNASRSDSSSAPVDPWCLTQSIWRPDVAARDETLFALANGALGVRGGFEESASPTQGTFVAGVWERAPIHHHERHFGFARTTDTRIPVADATAIRIRLGSVRVDPADGERLAFERTLDFRLGRLSRSVVWRTPQGVTFEVKAQRIVSLAHPGLVCIRWILRSRDHAGPVAIDSSIFGNRTAAAQGDDPRFGAGSGLVMQITHGAADANGAWLAQRTQASAIGVVCAQRHRVTGAAFAGASSDANGAQQSFAASLEQGASITIEKYIAYAWTQPQGAEDDAQLYTQAQATLDAAFSSGFASLCEAQARTYGKFWSGADLHVDSVDGGRHDEQALRFNLFHLFQSAGRDGSGGIAAKGLTGEGYEGHVFWDSETFVLPVFAFTAPALMKPSLVWRFRSLDRARAHAREMNHVRGALYPWRTIHGDECSAHYPSGSAQYHINAAVAFAIKLYIEASGDQAFLSEGGAEMLIETARIWLQLGHFNARRGGAFCIDAVTGPDEYTALIDNNYYTNRMAQEHLRYAVAVTRELAAKSPKYFDTLAQRLDLSGNEIADWSRAADAMYLPYDERLRIVAQDDTFLDKATWDFAGTPAEKYPLLMHHHPLTLYRHQVCKQADAVLALVLAGDNVDRAAKRRSFDYYEPITVHDSTLSASTFAILAAEVGYAEKAQRYLFETLRVDLDDLHANTGHGAHMAAMAGSWLALAWGFGGLRVSGGRIEFDPMLPPKWRGYRFGIVWSGRRFTVAVDAKAAHYTLLDGMPLEIAHAGRPLTLNAGSLQSRPLRDHAGTSVASAPQPERVQFPYPFQALIFDLDGVLADTAHLHLAAWKRLAGELGLPWADGIGEKLKGVDRAASLEIVLGAAANKYTKAQKQELADRKNGYYRSAIATFSAEDLLPGAHAALLAARAAGIKVALASASRSARELVERMGVEKLFDVVVDSATISRAKPDPEIFQRAAAALGVDPASCLGIEDAQAGIAAIKSAGMAALGVGDAQVLKQADAVLPDLTSFELDKFVAPA